MKPEDGIIWKLSNVRIVEANTSQRMAKYGGKQRYICKECGMNFIVGDERSNEKIAALKALVILFYSLGKGSYNMLGKIFGRSRSLIYRWVKEAGLATDEPCIDGEIKEN